jgi:Uma2 family endonuclease
MRESLGRMDDEAYLAFERSSEEKHELWDGEVFMTGGASLAHSLIVTRLICELGGALQGSACEVLGVNMRVRVPGSGYVYPDVMIVCGPEVEGEDDVLLNPRAVIDVLEPWFKWNQLDGYCSMPSVEEVLFVSQTERQVDHRTRQPDGSWVLRSYRGDDAVPLISLPAPLSLSRIYQGVQV